MRPLLPFALLAAACQQPGPTHEPQTVQAAPSAAPTIPMSYAARSPARAQTKVAQAAPPPSFRPIANCEMVGRGEWTAHVDAMPGPGSRPRLIVTGTIGVKPAARTVLRLDPAVMKSDPPQYDVILDINVPIEPTIDMLTRREVRGEWPVSGTVGAVHVRCGGRRVTTINDVVTAH